MTPEPPSIKNLIIQPLRGHLPGASSIPLHDLFGSSKLNRGVTGFTRVTTRVKSSDQIPLSK